MKARDVGCLLLTLGTTIGAAMLALPVVTAQESFLTTIAVVIASWAVMTMGAFALVKVNCALPLGTNLLSMARATTSRVGYLAMWVMYLFLLYSLLCGYLAGSSDVVQFLLAGIHLDLPRWAATLLTAFVIGSIVYQGIGSVDWVNRGLMLMKLLVLLVLMVVIYPSSHWLTLMSTSYHPPELDTLMVVLCSFGFAIILPSIRVYLGGDQKRLMRVLWISSLFPLFLYLLWIGLIQAAVPREGVLGLLAMNHSANTNSLLMQSLIRLTHSSWLHALSRIFVSICSLTAFLGVSLSLFDFLGDGLKKIGWPHNRLMLATVTFLPPLVIVLFDPRLFVQALAYAGVLCILVLVVMPFIMYIGARSKGLFTADQ